MFHRIVKKRIFQNYNEGLGLAACSDLARPCTRQDVTAQMSQKLSAVCSSVIKWRSECGL